MRNFFFVSILRESQPFWENHRYSGRISVRWSINSVGQPDTSTSCSTNSHQPKVLNTLKSARRRRLQFFSAAFLRESPLLWENHRHSGRITAVLEEFFCRFSRQRDGETLPYIKRLSSQWSLRAAHSQVKKKTLLKKVQEKKIKRMIVSLRALRILFQ